MAPLALLVGVGMMIRWKKDDIGKLSLALTLGVHELSGGRYFAADIYAFLFNGGSALGFVLALWTVASCGLAFMDRYGKHKFGFDPVEQGFQPHFMV